ncbi:MAG: CHASE3 domain-containing protein [Hormoscilla sp. GM7CHS1pb]|nr:CHASE3 domain-containing protein [Hormoscilla sp. GM7CHS1pb]
MIDAETGMRGYKLTQNQELLEHYHSCDRSYSRVPRETAGSSER